MSAMLNYRVLFFLTLFLCQVVHGKSPEDSDSLHERLTICEDGVSFCDKDVKVVLRGINIFSFYFANTQWAWGNFDHFTSQVDMLKSWGGNFIIVGYDPSRSRDAQYVSTILDGVEYAKNKGLYVELIQQHMIFNPEIKDDKYSLNIPQDIIVNDTNFNTNVSDDWTRFLSHPGVSEKARRLVDIFGLYSEPNMYSGSVTARDKYIRWETWRPRAEQACLKIRMAINRPAICSVSGITCGWDVTGMLTDPIHLPNIAAEIHQYKWHDDRGKTWDSDGALIMGRFPVIVGEFGYKDPPEYINNLLDNLRTENISWAAWPAARSWENNYNSPLVNIMIKELKRIDANTYKH